MRSRKEKRVTTRFNTEDLEKIKNQMEINNIKDISKTIRYLVQMGMSAVVQSLHNGGIPISDKKSSYDKTCVFCGNPAIWKIFYQEQNILVCQIHKNRHPFRKFGMKRI